jgi:hypothetical protein
MTFDVLLRLLRISIQIKSVFEMNQNYCAVGIAISDLNQEKMEGLLTDVKLMDK